LARSKLLDAAQSAGIENEKAFAKEGWFVARVFFDKRYDDHALSNQLELDTIQICSSAGRRSRRLSANTRWSSVYVEPGIFK